MKVRSSNFLRKLIRATNFWKDNHLILREFKYFRWIAIMAIAFSLIAGALEGISVGFISAFLQGLTNPNEPPIQTGLQWLDTSLLATEATASVRIYRLSGLLFITVWLRSGFEYLAQIYSSQAALNLVDRLRRRIFDQLVSLNLSFFTQTPPGELVSTIRGEVNQVQQAFSVMSVFIVQGAKVLAYLISMLLLSWQLFLASILVFALISVGMSSLTARVREAGFAIPKANQTFTANAFSFISGIRTVHASATQSFERKRYYQATQAIYDAQIRVIKLSNLVKPIIQGLGVTLLLGLVVISYDLLISSGRLTAAELLTFLFVLTRTTPLVSAVNTSWTRFMASQGALNAVSDLLKREDKPFFQNGHTEFMALQRAIEFRAVNFSYCPGESVLHDVTLSIKRGETTAFVGSSGAGKTTLVDLIPRFYDSTEGRILVDGIDLQTLEIGSFRRKMAIVSQDTYIFNATIATNITYGVENVTDHEMREAARMANALDFILDLPQGFETKVGNRGLRLSGGQRQRIAIARALLRDPEILILDEATSALDSVTEKLIQDSLEKLSRGRTVIAIAHRLSTIAQADKVVVLEKGHVVEQGSYQELINQRGKLWKYHQVQYEAGQTA
ncbi:MAG: heterocyst formation ABC transporter subunit HepA [Cyanobacteria bacterium P01_F01_bin.4]